MVVVVLLPPLPTFAVSTSAELTEANPIVDLSFFRRRNFALGVTGRTFPSAAPPSKRSSTGPA